MTRIKTLSCFSYLLFTVWHCFSYLSVLRVTLHILCLSTSTCQNFLSLWRTFLPCLDMTSWETSFKNFICLLTSEHMQDLKPAGQTQPLVCRSWTQLWHPVLVGPPMNCPAYSLSTARLLIAKSRGKRQLTNHL